MSKEQTDRVTDFVYGPKKACPHCGHKYRKTPSLIIHEDGQKCPKCGKEIEE